MAGSLVVIPQKIVPNANRFRRQSQYFNHRQLGLPVSLVGCVPTLLALVAISIGITATQGIGKTAKSVCRPDADPARL